MNTRSMNRPVRWLITTCLIMTLMLTLAGPARAANFLVTNLNDSGKGSLRQAILNANASAGADTITFGVSGTIVLSSILPTITDVAGLTIDGTGQSITLSGNDAVRVMFAYYGSVLTLRNLTVTGGNSGNSSGAGIINGGTLEVTNVTFSGNHTPNDGGAILNSGTLNVTGSTFSGNSGRGAGIFSYGIVIVNNSIFSGNFGGSGIFNGGGTLTVTGSTFVGNGDVGRGAGGAISNGNGTTTIVDSTFSGNSARGGGAIYNVHTLTLTNSSFSSNTALEGGGIYNSGGIVDVTSSAFSGNSAQLGAGISNHGNLAVSNSTFSGNSTADFGLDYYYGQGGGIYSRRILEVTNSTFLGNFAKEGGGIYSMDTLNVINSTFSGNHTNELGRGGGLYFSGYFGGQAVVTASTFSDNSAQEGGGIFGGATLQNTIVANSTGGNCALEGALIDGGGNLSWPDTTCSGLNADPLLGPLQDNGGSTQTQALLPGSPAIDAASLENCPAADQRGISRPQGAGCDIGAYERVVYTFSGFFQPVDNLPTWNVVQAGVGVPVRFSLGGDQGLNIFAAGYPLTQKIACSSGVPQDVIEETVLVGSSSLSYDAASDTYTYAWKTNKAWANTCRQLVIRLNDGSEHTAKFKFVR